MLTLALDSATQTVGVALVKGESLLAELFLNLGRHHAEVLLPALDQICRLAGITIDQIDLLACTTGPGSFTGVRTGVCTLKGLGLAANKPLVGVSVLEALAMNVAPFPARVCPLLDARKNQVYAGLYRIHADGFPEPLLREVLTDVDPFLHSLDGEVTFVGEGAIRYRKEINAILADRARFAGPLQNTIRGAAVACLGQRSFQRGEADDPLTLMPRYLRASEAEVHRRGLCANADVLQTEVDRVINVSYK